MSFIIIPQKATRRVTLTASAVLITALTTLLEPDMNHYRDDTGTGNVLRSAGSGLRAWLSCADASAPGSGGPTAPNSKLIGASPPLMRVACSTTNESLPMSRTTRPTDGESREADTV